MRTCGELVIRARRKDAATVLASAGDAAVGRCLPTPSPFSSSSSPAAAEAEEDEGADGGTTMMSKISSLHPISCRRGSTDAAAPAPAGAAIAGPTV